MFKKAFVKPVIVIDLFTGSGNLLYNVSKGINATKAYGSEVDELIFEKTKKNLEILNFEVSLLKMDYLEFGVKLAEEISG